MYRAVIADDENKVKKAIKVLGNWEEHQIEIIAEYSDGDALYEAIKKAPVDIIITDMRMPGLSGEELIRALREADPAAQIIIISGYDDFQYARQAIISKAVDYLLKPIDEDSLNNALENAVAALKENHSEKNTHAFYNDVLEGTYSREDAAADPFIGPNVIENSYTVSLFQLFLKAPQSIGDDELKQLITRAANRLDQTAGERGVIFPVIKRKNEIIAIFKDLAKAESKSLTEEMLETLDKEFGLTGVSAAGRSHEGLSQIKYSYVEAQSALPRIDLKNPPRLVFYDEPPFTGTTVSSEFTQMEFIIHTALESGNIYQIKKNTERLYHFYQNTENYYFDHYKRTLSILKQALEKLMLIETADSEYNHRLNQLHSAIPYILDMDLLYTEFGRLFQTIMLETAETGYSEKQSRAMAIKEYLDNHYTEKISLTDISASLFLNKEYISKIFKEEFNLKIFDYIDNLRIEQAKKMLLSGRHTVGEVAYELGFYDESHFTRKFKKIAGVSPKNLKL